MTAMNKRDQVILKVEEGRKRSHESLIETTLDLRNTKAECEKVKSQNEELNQGAW
jgi:hypothetical protein